MKSHSTYLDVQTGQARPSAYEEAARQIREAAAKRLDLIELARRARVRCIKEQALADVPLDFKEWGND